MHPGTDGKEARRSKRRDPGLGPVRPSIFGLNLRRLREASTPKVTQGEIGAAAGLEQSSISQLERGEIQYPSADAAMKMAQFFRVPIEEFWAPVDEPGPEPHETLREFLDSPIGKRLSPEDRAELRRAGWVLRKPTVAAWQRLWDALEEGRRQQ
jgi:transcriptional regulator with XRE-family HTH domain